MAKTRKANGPGHNQAEEKPFFDRLVNLERQIRELREDKKVVKAEAKEADIKVGPLELSVKRYLETAEQRNARISKETEAERILRALGEFINTPLGEAAAAAATADEWAREEA